MRNNHINYGLIACAAVGILILFAGRCAAAEPYVIRNDLGGPMARYFALAEQLRAEGRPVRVDGTCASACTLLIELVPDVCITRRARLGFHQAFQGEATFVLAYRPEIVAWIDRHGGLPEKGVLWMDWWDARHIYRPC